MAVLFFKDDFILKVHTTMPGGGAPGHRLRYNDQDNGGEVGK